MSNQLNNYSIAQKDYKQEQNCFRELNKLQSTNKSLPYQEKRFSSTFEEFNKENILKTEETYKGIDTCGKSTIEKGISMKEALLNMKRASTQSENTAESMNASNNAINKNGNSVLENVNKHLNINENSIVPNENNEIINNDNSNVQENKSNVNKTKYEKKTYLYNKSKLSQINQTQLNREPRGTKLLDEKLGVNDILLYNNKLINDIDDSNLNDFNHEQIKIDQEIKNLKMNSNMKLSTPNKTKTRTLSITNNKSITPNITKNKPYLSTITSKSRMGNNTAKKLNTKHTESFTSNKKSLNTSTHNSKISTVPLTNRSNNTNNLGKNQNSIISKKSDYSKTKRNPNPTITSFQSGKDVYYKKITPTITKLTKNSATKVNDKKAASKLDSSRAISSTPNNKSKRSISNNSKFTSLSKSIIKNQEEIKIKNITDGEEYKTILDEIQDIFGKDLSQFNEKRKYTFYINFALVFFENLDSNSSAHLIKCLIMIGVIYKEENNQLKSETIKTPLSKKLVYSNVSSSKSPAFKTIDNSVPKRKVSSNLKIVDQSKEVQDLKKLLLNKDNELSKIKTELNNLKGCVKTSMLICLIKLLLLFLQSLMEEKRMEKQLQEVINKSFINNIIILM